MTYTKQDAVMTRGLAILSMLVLHLFCRTGADVFGTPLLWLNETIPFVFLFGFFSEICVSLYSLCAGYAQQIISEKGKSSWKSNARRALRLMVNYWIVLVLFCVLGLIFAPGGDIPGKLTDFLKSIVLLHSYNGAWWYLRSYLILMLIPPMITLAPVRKLPVWTGLLGCLVLQVGLYFANQFDFLSNFFGDSAVLRFIWTEAKNLIEILPAFWCGAFLCKGRAVEKIGKWLDSHFSRRMIKFLLLGVFSVLFIGFNVILKRYWWALSLYQHF